MCPRFGTRDTAPSCDGMQATVPLLKVLKRLSGMLNEMHDVGIRIGEMTRQEWRDGEWKDVMELISL